MTCPKCVRKEFTLCWQHPKNSNSLEMPRIRVQPNRRDAPYFELTSQNNTSDQNERNKKRCEEALLFLLICVKIRTLMMVIVLCQSFLKMNFVYWIRTGNYRPEKDAIVKWENCKGKLPGSNVCKGKFHCHPKISNTLEMPCIQVQPNRRDAPISYLNSQYNTLNQE